MSFFNLILRTYDLSEVTSGKNAKTRNWSRSDKSFSKIQLYMLTQNVTSPYPQIQPKISENYRIERATIKSRMDEIGIPNESFAVDFDAQAQLKV